MNSIYETFLGDLIELNNLKIVPEKKKKVITSCIFIPEKPGVTDKTYNYFAGLIKSIETFSKKMPGWIYRIYLDELFVTGISQDKSTSVFKSVYNNLSSTNNEGSPYREQIKKGIKFHRGDLKKMQLLLNLFIENIIKSKDPQYKNIEIVSFKCPKANYTNKYPGHSFTFGSIMRLLVLFDEDVDVFVSVNSRYPMNHLISLILNDFDRRREKKILSAVYQTPTHPLHPLSSFMSGFIDESIYQYFKDAKSRKTPNENDSLFIDVIDSILELKQSIVGIKDHELNFDSLKIGEETEESYLDGIESIVSSQKEPLTLSQKIKISSSMGAGFFGFKRDETFIPRLEIFAKFLRFLILSKDKFLFGIDELFLKIILCPEAGTMEPERMRNGNVKIDYMNTSIDIIETYNNKQLAKLCKENDIDISKFGEIDGKKFLRLFHKDYHKVGMNVKERLDFKEKREKLKIFEVDYIYYLDIDSYGPFTSTYPEKEDHTYLINSKYQRVFHRKYLGREEDNENNNMVVLGEQVDLNKLIGNDKLFDIGIYESRSLFRSRKEDLKKETPIFKMISLQGEDLSTIYLNFDYLFASYNEFKKLFIYKKHRERSYEGLDEVFRKPDAREYFTEIDINEFGMEDIDAMLEIIIDHFRKDDNEPNLKTVILTEGKLEDMGRLSRHVYDYKVIEGPAGITRKKRGKGRKSKKKKR